MQEANGKFSNGGARGRLLLLHIQWHRESMILADRLLVTQKEL